MRKPNTPDERKSSRVTIRWHKRKGIRDRGSVQMFQVGWKSGQVPVIFYCFVERYDLTHIHARHKMMEIHYIPTHLHPPQNPYTCHKIMDTSYTATFLHPYKPNEPTIIQPTNESTNQPTNQSTNQLTTNQPISQPTNN